MKGMKEMAEDGNKKNKNRQQNARSKKKSGAGGAKTDGGNKAANQDSQQEHVVVREVETKNGKAVIEYIETEPENTRMISLENEENMKENTDQGETAKQKEEAEREEETGNQVQAQDQADEPDSSKAKIEYIEEDGDQVAFGGVIEKKPPQKKQSSKKQQKKPPQKAEKEKNACPRQETKAQRTVARETQRLPKSIIIEQVAKNRNGRNLERGEAIVEYIEEDETEGAVFSPVVPKAVYRICIVLIVVILGLIIWINRANFTPESVMNWVSETFTPGGTGDGYPVTITGSSVEAGNFYEMDGNVIAVSDTAITALDSTAKEQYAHRHNFSNPAVSVSGQRQLVYNLGGKSYIMLNGDNVKFENSTDDEILAASVSSGGNFAIGLKGSFASYLNAYDKNGELMQIFRFSNGYITAMALSPDSSSAAVCTVEGSGGEMISKVTVVDFSREDPVSEYELGGNIFLGVTWNTAGRIIAVGDTKTAVGERNGNYEEYDYGGRALVSMCFENDRAFACISGYANIGASTLLTFYNSVEPLEIELSEHAKAISSKFGTVSVLAGDQARFFDCSTGVETGSVRTGVDSKGIALTSETKAYVLGVSNIRFITAG